MKLTDILSILPMYEVTEDIAHIRVASIEMDHRKINKDDLFICVKGFTVDGHTFAQQAVENGAGVIIAEKKIDVPVPVVIVPDTTRALAMIATKYYDFPTDKLSLIGITGTNGKTTITYLLESIYNQHNKKTGIIGTIQVKIGEETFPVKNTTPDALQLQKTFKQMNNKQVDTAIMEVSSHALDLGRVHGCNFDIALFTNLSQDHLDFHKDMEDYFYAKSLLFSQLGNSYSIDQGKFSILNEDDPYGRKLKRHSAQPILTYGCTNKADVMATNIELNIYYTKFTLTTPKGNIEVNSQLIGMFNVYNMLAASSIAIADNIPLDTIKHALENIEGIDGRFERVNVGQNFALIVDYAHTPDSLENVLVTIKDFAEKNVYVVVGCGGDRDRTKRPLMAKIALKYGTKAIFTSDNPRTEDPKSILSEMTEGLHATNYEVIVDRKDAINRAVELASEDDIILIAGKGHETYQEINHVRYEFDDRVVAKEAIESKGLK